MGQPGVGDASTDCPVEQFKPAPEYRTGADDGAAMGCVVESPKFAVGANNVTGTGTGDAGQSVAPEGLAPQSKHAATKAFEDAFLLTFKVSIAVGPERYRSKRVERCEAVRDVRSA